MTNNQMAKKVKALKPPKPPKPSAVFGEAKRARVHIVEKGSTDRRSGRKGATVIVTVGVKYPKSYHIAMHGLTPAEAVEKVHEIEAQHAVKEQKVDALRSAVGVEFAIGLERFRIIDATVMERGSNPELVMQVARLDGERWVRMGGMPIRRVAAQIGDVPTGADAEAIAIAFANAWVVGQAEHEQFISEVATLLEAESA